MNFDLSGNSNDDTAGPTSVRHKKRTKFTTGKKQVVVADEISDDEDKVFVRSPTKVVVVEDNPPSNKESRSVPEQQETTAPTELSPRQKLMLIPRAHMTKAEKRRLQLELDAAAIEKLTKDNTERAEMLGLLSPNMQKEVKADKPYRRENHSNTSSDVTSKDRKASVTFVEPDFVPGLGEVPGKGSRAQSQSELRLTEYRSSTKLKASKPFASKEPTTQVSAIPLTRAELKRLQWDKEKGERACSRILPKLKTGDISM